MKQSEKTANEWKHVMQMKTASALSVLNKWKPLSPIILIIWIGFLDLNRSNVCFVVCWMQVITIRTLIIAYFLCAIIARAGSVLIPIANLPGWLSHHKAEVAICGDCQVAGWSIGTRLAIILDWRCGFASIIILGSISEPIHKDRLVLARCHAFRPKIVGVPQGRSPTFLPRDQSAKFPRAISAKRRYICKILSPPLFGLFLYSLFHPVRKISHCIWKYEQLCETLFIKYWTFLRQYQKLFYQVIFEEINWNKKKFNLYLII